MRSVFLRIENSATAVHTYAPIGLLPLSIDKVHLNMRFAVMALERDTFDQNFDARNSQHCPSNTHKLIDQV